ncbi:MAG: valine--tRNA ligase [bacterium]
MLETKYNHEKVEEGKYKYWLENNLFESLETDKRKEPYAIVIPPPNVTGKLHLGHAWDTALQDILIRYKKLNNFDAVWIPGMDHAGIATQAKIDAKLKDMGINPRGISREEWLKHAWSWKEEYSENIRAQWSKLGLSLCYSKERFTLDEGLNKAVNEVFVKLYKEGLIYRGKKIINWDPLAKTALSNEEVIYKDVKGAFYHINYQVKDTDIYLEVATTRPETMFGDTALAVNPNDERYKDFIGKKAILPILNREIPIVGDEHVELDFGTGVLKVTPAHDPNDFEIGKRHNLEIINCLNTDGTLNEVAEGFVNLDRVKARKEVIKKLEELGNLVKIEEMTHSVGHSERTDEIVEPYLSNQWFVKMRPLADRVLENQEDKDNKVNFVPSRYEKTMIHWMEITYDWCISRQLWWGHKIPAWYKEDEIYVGLDAPSEDGWIQDEDVLDTWFSSALWPFSTLGWPDNKSDDLSRYYPNNVLVTGYDIIPFWVNRMTFQGLHFTEKRPFKDCLIHGLIRDKDGRKMSKSLGNGVDPMDVIEKYGADALRFFLTTSSSAGTDLRYDEEKVAASWNFLNKLWNASRYVLMNTEDLKEVKLTNLEDKDKWILTKYNNTIKEVKKNMEKYDFNLVGTDLYNFIWSDFCDNYIEMSKFSLDKESTQSTLIYVLNGILKMMHPFTPFITEEIYKMISINNKESIMLSSYPEYNKEEIYKEETEKIEETIEFIKIFRNIKLENKITKDFELYIEKENDYTLINKLLKLDTQIVTEKQNKTSFIVNTKNYEMVIYFEKQETEEDKLLREKNIENLKASISRRENLLSNENYVSRAPKELVEKEKESLEKEKEELSKLI